MNILHNLVAFFCPFIFGLSIDGGTVAGSGDGSGTGAAAGDGGGTGTGAGAGGGSGQSPANFDLRTHLDDGGKFKPGWAKGAGLPETWEGKYTDPLSALRAGASAQSLIGADKATVVRIPGANASQAERDAFYAQMGRPAKPEEYGFTKPEKFGDKTVPDAAWDSKRAGVWQQKLFEMGVPKETAQKIMLAAVEESMTGMGMIADAQAAIVKQGNEALKKEWGTDFDTNLAAARRAAEEFGGKELIDHPGLGNDPVMIKALAKIGRQMTESPGKGIRQSGGEQRLSAADARVEGNKLTADMVTRSKADRNFKNTPEYAQMAARKTELFQMANPEE